MVKNDILVKCDTTQRLIPSQQSPPLSLQQLLRGYHQWNTTPLCPLHRRDALNADCLLDFCHHLFIRVGGGLDDKHATKHPAHDWHLQHRPVVLNGSDAILGRAESRSPRPVVEAKQIGDSQDVHFFSFINFMATSANCLASSCSYACPALSLVTMEVNPRWRQSSLNSLPLPLRHLSLAFNCAMIVSDNLTISDALDTN